MATFGAARLLVSAAASPQFPPDTGREVAFAGRSNSGKSSAINAILARRGLARTSAAPGRTQLVNFFELATERRLVDLPGYGFARAPRVLRERWLELLDAFFATRGSLHGLFLLVDVRRELNPADWKLIRWTAARGCPLTLLLTKTDKLGRSTAARALTLARERLDGADVLLFSAPSGAGVAQARARLERWLDIDLAAE